MNINIIGDIAGRFDELMLLLQKLPPAELTIAVGDLMDRGPKSKEVIEYFIKTPNIIALYGNHEDLMHNALVNGDASLWLYNGGFTTVESYGGSKELIPEEHIKWLRKLPLYFKNNEIIVTHAPLDSQWYSAHSLPKKFQRANVEDFIWNRIRPQVKFEDKFMVYGHNGRLLTVNDANGEMIAQCIDNSRDRQLAAMHWPTKEIFTQDFL